MIFNCLTNVIDSAKGTESVYIGEVPYDTLEWYWVLLMFIGLIIFIAFIGLTISFFINKLMKKN